MDSPFNRSTMTSRSPPPKRQGEEASTPAPTIEAVSTAEIEKWLSSIEQCLNDICIISSEGKLNSDQKLKISSLSRSVMGGVSQLAVQYQALKQKYISSQIIIQNHNDQKGISVQIEDKIEDLKECIRSAPKTPAQNTSFADVVKKGHNSIVRPPSTSSIIVYPTNKEKSSEDLKKLIQTLIKPEELKLHIRGMRKTKDGGVIISAEGKDDIEKLKQSEQLKNSGLKLEDKIKRRPKIILLGVPTSTPEKEVLECLYEQNISDKYPHVLRDNFLSSIKLSHKSGRRDSSHCNFILELPADIRNMIIQQERVFINWTSCPVRDFTIVTRCYKCQQYGHSAKYCRDTDSTCGHCGCMGHTIKECSKLQEPPKCASCQRYNKPSQHRTGDALCPARKSAEARYLNSIDYGGA